MNMRSKLHQHRKTVTNWKPVTKNQSSLVFLVSWHDTARKDMNRWFKSDLINYCVIVYYLLTGCQFQRWLNSHFWTDLLLTYKSATIVLPLPSLGLTTWIHSACVMSRLWHTTVINVQGPPTKSIRHHVTVTRWHHKLQITCQHLRTLWFCQY